MASMLTSEKESINLSTRNRREDVKRAEKSFDQGKHREGMGDHHLEIKLRTSIETVLRIPLYYIVQIFSPG